MSAVCGRRRPGAERILRIGIVINELCEVREDGDLKLERLSRGLRRDNFLSAFFAIGLRRFACTASEGEIKRVFPLFSETFRIDVGVPNHRRGDDRVGHSATRQGYIFKAFVAQIRLADIDSVAAFCEWSAATGGGTRCVVTKRHV